jgi:hypothetical protein
VNPTCWWRLSSATQPDSYQFLAANWRIRNHQDLLDREPSGIHGDENKANFDEKIQANLPENMDRNQGMKTLLLTIQYTFVHAHL